MGHTILPAPLPKPFALFDGDLANNGNVVVTANQCIYVGVVLQVPIVLTGIRVNWNTAGNGHYDVGIYDASGSNPFAGAPGNLLAHAAAGATLLTVAGAQTPAFLSGNLALAPGRYWLALWADNALDKFVRAIGVNNSDIVLANQNTGGPLPATAIAASGGAPVNTGASKPILIGLLQGGWS